jgi:hypothetical protein
MGETNEKREGEVKFPEPYRPWSVIMASRDKHRRSGTPGASPEEEAPNEAHVPQSQDHLPVRPPGPRGRSGQRLETYKVEVVCLSHVPVNRENPFATVSASERYECVMGHFADIWSAICRRRKAAFRAPTERKLAA